MMRHRSPLFAAWAAGVDPTRMIIGLVARGAEPDAVLMADTGSERPKTDCLVPTFRAWLHQHGIMNHVVRYEPEGFRRWPPYHLLLENLLTNGTLPTVSFRCH